MVPGYGSSLSEPWAGARRACANCVCVPRRYAHPMATTWEYATIPLIIHNTKAVLDQWGADGWELVQVVTGPDGNGLVAYLKRPTGE